MLRMWAAIQSRLNNEKGASLVEYAILLTLIAVVSIGSITLVGQEVDETFDCVGIELGEPAIRHTVLEKLKASTTALNVIEARFAASCL